MSITPGGVDRVLLDGRILTVDPAFSVAQAVAIQDGRIVAVGSNDEINTLRGARTTTDHLDGATILPGLIDAHNHLLSTGQVLQQVQLYDCRSIPEILDRLSRQAAATPPGQWILGKGWDESLLAERRHPTRWELDRVAPNHPVVLHRVWNKLVANSPALAAAGVSRDTPDPPSGERYAGGFERDLVSGEPTGLFRDRAKDLILRAIPAPTPEQLVEAIATACRAYNAVGLVGAGEPGLHPDGIRAFHAARDAGKLSVRTDMLLGAWGFAPASREPELKRWIEEMGVHGGFGDAWLRLEGVKFLLDGGVGDRTARFYTAYAAEPASQGQWVVDPDEYPRLVRWVHDLGWSIDTHTCGDAAQDLAVRAYASAQEEAPNPRLRHRVHHAYLPTSQALTLMSRHAIPALVSNPFIVNLGESFVVSLGEDRASRIMPMTSYLRAGVPLAGTSDSPITDFNPWLGLYGAVARTTVTGRELDTGERISRVEAIRSYTIGGAFATGVDHSRGSLEVGKLADLIQIDRDPLAVDDASLRDTVVERTMLDGEWVYERSGA